MTATAAPLVGTADLKAVVVETLRLAPITPSGLRVHAGPRSSTVLVDVAFKAHENLDIQTQELTWVLRERERLGGIRQGGVLVTLSDGDGPRWPMPRKLWSYRFAPDGVFKLNPDVANRQPVAGAVRYAVNINIPAPRRPEDSRWSLRLHPPHVGRQWKCSLPLPYDAHMVCRTKLCRRRIGERGGPTPPLELDPEVIAWCKDSIGPFMFASRTATMLFRNDTDRLAFRLCWL